MSRFRIFGGGKAQDTLERCRGWARIINLAEEDTRRLSDGELRHAINVLKQRHQDGEDLDALLPETFAIVREAAARTLGERPYDEQLIGGAALHLGTVVEMKTGEGKTLTAVLPACLHALAGNGVHVLTANEYLAARDAEWMGPVYRFLGLTCALLPTEGSPDDRHAVYSADVVYGTSNLAYDYLRDHMAWEPSEVVQRGHFSAIVDEADLVMLDEAGLLPQVSRTVDGPSDHAQLAALAAGLERGVHYTVDEARRFVTPTEQGMAVVEDRFGAGVYSGGDAGLAKRLNAALRAKELYVRDRDYVVVDGAVWIIDQATQRVISDRTLGDGMDQAVDAKEGLDVRPERRTLAVIDGHAYLGLYTRLAGMTGVVEGEVDAYQDLYGLECVRVPPHRPVRRVDREPVIYATDEVMLRAMVKTVDEKRSAGRPTLIGTTSDAAAERISQALHAKNIDHDVLTARNHELEAEIIARAGRPGAVTVLTRMAGRGVDIRLAEPDGAGLFVLGVGPMASRRLELHLRGRAGRGGDPGESAFFVSARDPYIKLPKILDRIFDGPDIDQPAAGRLIVRAVTGMLNELSAHATQRLEAILRYSAVREEQRAAVYARRDHVFRNGVPPGETNRIIEKAMRTLVLAARTGPEDVDRLSAEIRDQYPATVGREAIAAGLADGPSSTARAELIEAVVRDALAASVVRESSMGSDVAKELRRRVMLTVIDQVWRAQLRDLEDAESGVGLRTAAGGDPLAEYRRAASRLVTTMWEEIDAQFVGYWFNLRVEIEPIGTEDAGA
jgi:preprotein translocase subunit SecA